MGERTEQLDIFCHVTGFTSDFTVRTDRDGLSEDLGSIARVGRFEINFSGRQRGFDSVLYNL